MAKKEEHKCIEGDDLLNQTKVNIEKFGLQVIMVSSTDYLPSFAYSIGLYEKYKHPEIICFGLSDKLGHEIINDVASLIKNGETIRANTNYNTIFENSKAEFLSIDPKNIDDYFGAAIEYYNTDSFPALQLIWTDKNNRFPWEENFQKEFLYTQPLLDRNADFKFREAKNLGIFTTKQWLQLGEPILRVVHDNDGDWQFLTKDFMPEDVKIVALEQMILKDKTLNDIFYLDYGQAAERESVGGEWTIIDEEYEEEND